MNIPPEKLKKATDILVKQAQTKSIISYSGLYEQIDLDRSNPGDRQIGSYILGEISRQTLPEKGVMLSALAFGRAENEPAEGFYDLAQELGRLSSGATEEERTKFWIEEVRRCWDAYAA